MKITPSELYAMLQLSKQRSPKSKDLRISAPPDINKTGRPLRYIELHGIVDLDEVCRHLNDRDLLED